jgi:hypothetical protein
MLWSWRRRWERDRGECAEGTQGLDNLGEEPVVMERAGCCGEGLTGIGVMSGREGWRGLRHTLGSTSIMPNNAINRDFKHPSETQGSKSPSSSSSSS